jgi:hypothetical protein
MSQNRPARAAAAQALEQLDALDQSGRRPSQNRVDVDAEEPDPNAPAPRPKKATKKKKATAHPIAPVTTVDAVRPRIGRRGGINPSTLLTRQLRVHMRKTHEVILELATAIKDNTFRQGVVAQVDPQEKAWDVLLKSLRQSGVTDPRTWDLIVEGDVVMTPSLWPEFINLHKITATELRPGQAWTLEIQSVFAGTFLVLPPKTLQKILHAFQAMAVQIHHYKTTGDKHLFTEMMRQIIREIDVPFHRLRMDDLMEKGLLPKVVADHAHSEYVILSGSNVSNVSSVLQHYRKYMGRGPTPPAPMTNRPSHKSHKRHGKPSGADKEKSQKE